MQHPRQALDIQGFAGGQVEQDLGHGQQIAAVAVGQGQHGLTRLGRERQGPLHMGLGPRQQLIQGRIVQPLQHIDLGPRQ